MVVATLFSLCFIFDVAMSMLLLDAVKNLEKRIEELEERESGKGLYNE